MRTVSLSVPRLPEGLIPNLLGVGGMLTIAVCIGGFLAANGVSGAWWVTGLTAGGFAWLLAWINSRPEDEPEDEPGGDAKALLHSVPAAASSASPASKARPDRSQRGA